MAKGSRDLILRDRLQFDVDASGDTALVYGRVDLSDFVNVVKREGMSIKEIRYQIRAPAQNNGVFLPSLVRAAGGANPSASIKVFGTTTAYENIEDVGIASPDVINVLEMTTTAFDDGVNITAIANQWTHFGTPDLHPEGYHIVSDLLVGVAVSNITAQGSPLEIDVMVIGEPVKLTEADMTEMLTQQQDL